LPARAAVVPSVLEGALGEWPSTWECFTFSPGRDPKSALRRALAPLFAGAPLPETPEEIADAVAATVDATGRGALLLVDALEEAVTLATPEGLADLARFVAAAAATRPGFRVVVTVRRDFLDPLLAANSWATALTRGAVLVPPLSAAVLAGVLDDRLAAYGYALEDDALRTELTKQLEGSAESMPLVEFALARLWNERDEKRRVIPTEALARIGGIGGALQQHADQVLEALPQEIARDILVGLTTSKGTRARRTRSDVLRPIRDPQGESVLAALEKARLVVADEGLYTLAHEALLAQWPRLRAWIVATARARATAEEVEEAAERWRERGGTDLLLRGAPLASARDVAANPSIHLTQHARRFGAAAAKG
jgi:eukaryotic-like serine/threonine-protein kinase